MKIYLGMLRTEENVAKEKPSTVSCCTETEPGDVAIFIQRLRKGLKNAGDVAENKGERHYGRFN